MCLYNFIFFKKMENNENSFSLSILQSYVIKNIKVHSCSIFSVGYLYYNEMFLFVPITLNSILFDFDIPKSAFFLLACAGLRFSRCFVFQPFSLLLSLFQARLPLCLLRHRWIWPIHIYYDNWKVSSYSLLSYLFTFLFSIYLFLLFFPPLHFLPICWNDHI